MRILAWPNYVGKGSIKKFQFITRSPSIPIRGVENVLKDQVVADKAKKPQEDLLHGSSNNPFHPRFTCR